MSRQPIETAPRDGTKVIVRWTDRDGQENESVAQFRDAARLRACGGDWDGTDTGWWAFIDSDTQKRISPHSWTRPGGEEEAEL